MHVTAIDVAVTSANGPFTKAVATVTVVDDQGAPASGVTVSGWFTGDTSGSASATTGGAGTATLESALKKGGSSWTFCVTALSGSGIMYDAEADAESCDSTG